MAVLPDEGMTLKMTIASTPTLVGQILKLKAPGGEVTVVEKTVLTDTHKRKRPGLIPDAGEVTFGIQYDPNNTVHQLLRSRVDAPSLTNDVFTVTYVDGMVVPAHDTFNGFVSKFEIQEAEGENNLEADVTITIDGGVTTTAGAAS